MLDYLNVVNTECSMKPAPAQKNSGFQKKLPFRHWTPKKKDLIIPCEAL
jgi:hypothetical protein